MKAIPAEVSGRITSPVKVDGDRADFEMIITDLNTQKAAREKVVVQVKLVRKQEVKTAQLWKRGDVVSLAGSLEPPGPARNFGGFDYRQYLRTKGIHWMLKVKGADAVEALQPEEWSPANVLRRNDDLRQYIGERIDRLFGSFHGGYMKGLIIGDQTDLDPDTFAEFSRLGLTHILAISGMHVAVFVGTLLFVFSACRLTRESSLTAVIFLIPLYVLLTGASPSVIRAGMMGMIGLYAARRGLLKDGKHILCAAALAMLWYNPYFLVNVSFQLSFLVTAGLMIFVPKLMPLLSFLPRWLGSSVAVTAAAQLVSFPLTIYYFNQFSLLSLPANLLLVPLISLIVLPLGMAAVMAGFIWLDLGKWIASLAKWLNTFTFEVVEWMNGSPGFVTIWPSPSLWWIAIYFVVLYFLLHVMEKRKQRQTDTDTMDETVPLAGARDGFGGHPARSAHTGGYRWVGPLRLQAASVSRFAAVRSLARLLNKTSIPAVVPLLGLFAVLLYTGYQGPSLHGSGLVQFLDVGQGDSILVSTPGGKHVLIDGGGTTNFRKEKDAWKDRSRPFEVGAKVVVPLLKKRGVHSLDMIMISHNDKDHAGACRRFWRRFRSSRSCLTAPCPRRRISKSCLKRLSQRKYRYIRPERARFTGRIHKRKSSFFTQKSRRSVMRKVFLS
ncbi:ComEC/Rec2 family competence protein [Paenibacillus sp. DMB20]|uniref:ComEC/Rec2 family competence protein n=1 Tax=Paenibacillus sp. DMB20 TaxID=1642570 RepID=UPI001F1D5102|nr:ComEC/Rec2 family competence protein [Paenibacillus sp. DMB20]